MDSRSFDPTGVGPRLGRVLWWSELGAIAVIVAGFGLDLATSSADLIVAIGVGLLVATPFAATVVVAVLSGRRGARLTAFAVATLVVAVLGVVAALATAGR